MSVATNVAAWAVFSPPALMGLQYITISFFLCFVKEHANPRNELRLSCQYNSNSAKIETNHMEKRHQLAIDILIAILVVAVIILIDHLFVDLRSKPADDVWNRENIEEQEGENGQEGKKGYYQLKVGERAFVPILDFHHIGTAPANADKITRSYFIEPLKFEQILKDLLDNDYRPFFVSEVVDYLSKKQLPQEKIMAITFDDGNEDFYTQAWPILQKYNIKTSIYIMTGVGGSNYLSKDQIIELAESGLVEIGSHTVWHPKLTKISSAEALKELTDSKKMLADLLGKDITVICYPFGLYNDQIKELAGQAGYQAGLTYDQDAWQDPDDLLALKRISIYPELNIVKLLDKLKTEN